MRVVLAIIAWIMLTNSVSGGFLSWSGRLRQGQLSIDYTSSIDERVVIACQNAGRGLSIRVVSTLPEPHTAVENSVAMSLDLDGQRIFTGNATATAVGDSLIASEMALNIDQAWQFVDGLRQAHQEILIRDGVSADPRRINLTGLNRFQDALSSCLRRQEQS